MCAIFVISYSLHTKLKFKTTVLLVSSKLFKWQTPTEICHLFPHQVIEEIVEMMENSPDPGETEEEEDDDIGVSSSKSSPSLLEEIRMLSQASNNNCSYEGAHINLQLINICEPQDDFLLHSSDR